MFQWVSHKKKAGTVILHVEAYSSAQLLVLLRSCQSRSKASEVCNLPKAWRGAAALIVVRRGGPVEVVRASAMEGNGSDHEILPNSLIQATRQALI